MHFYAGFRKKDQYTAPLFHMRNIEKEKQERVDETEKLLEYLTKLRNALSSFSVCIEEAMTTEERIKEAKARIAKQQSDPLANKAEKLKGQKEVTTAKKQVGENSILVEKAREKKLNTVE